MDTPPQKKPKLDNNALFAQRLIDNPPEYNHGDLVNSSFGIAYISGRIFSDRENRWKYTVNPYGLKNFHVDAEVYSNYTQV